MSHADETRAVCIEEAARKLRRWLGTGIEGFKVEALDRLRAVGIDPAAYGTDRAGLKWLLRELDCRQEVAKRQAERPR